MHSIATLRGCATSNHGSFSECIESHIHFVIRGVHELGFSAPEPKQRPRLQRWLDSAVIVVRDCKRAERYATQPFGAGDAEDIALETEDYFKCFLLQGAVYRGLDAIDPILNVDDL